jgi:Holliday junction resolvase RusA-like endonuclease
MTAREISFYVRGLPVPQPRPRAGRKKDGSLYVYQPNDDAVTVWRRTVELSAAFAMRDCEPIKGAFRVSIAFNFARPRSHFKEHFGGIELKEGAPMDHTSKPDLDNLAKSTLDAIVKSGIVEDDAKAVAVTLTKQWAKFEDGAMIVLEALT